MQTVPSSAPQPKFGDIGPGTAFRTTNVSPPQDWIKGSDGATAIRLTNGQIQTFAETELITPAPNASYTMWPS